MTAAPRVLIIDDDPSLLQVVEAIARNCGYHVVTSMTPGTVLETLRRYDPALVITDLAMPELDGVEIMRGLASNKMTTTKVMLLSQADQKTINAAQRLGQEYGLDMAPPVRKPFEEEDLHARLRTVHSGLCDVTAAELASALEHGQLEVRYQPKVSLQSADDCPVIGAEALVRWRHPSRGLLKASQFIAMAEREGLIEPLSLWVLSDVLRQLKDWESKKLRPVAVAVNLPAGLLEDLDFPDRLETLLAEFGVSADRLMLEITERVAMHDGPAATDVLTRLRLKGIALSIDDFGVGHSSMVELYRMPFNELKIDASFVRDMTINHEARTIVKALISMSHELGLEVCAEGVESEQAFADLQVLGCDKAQGFLFGSAKPAATFEGYLLEETSAASPSPMARLLSEEAQSQTNIPSAA